MLLLLVLLSSRFHMAASRPTHQVDTAQQAGLAARPKYTVERVTLPGRRQDMLLAPREPGSYKVLCFHHGTALRANDYADLLSQIAQEGFIVIAPQLYRPWELLLTSVDKERRLALDAQRWVLDEVGGLAVLPPGVRADYAGGLYVGGHSRGGGIAWLTAADRQGAPPVAGWLGVDPVDTAAVPAAWLRMPSFSTNASRWPASLVFGTGLGPQAPACAPAGFNHLQFWDKCTAPAWHLVAPNAGHVDMLDDDEALDFLSNAACRLCKASRLPKAAVRTWLGGAMAAFMTPGGAAIDEYLARPSPELDIVVGRKTLAAEA